MSTPFTGKWIGDPAYTSWCPQNVFRRERESLPGYQHPAELRNRHMLARCAFRVPEGTRKVVLRITADDYYKVSVNGLPAGQGPAPGYYFQYYYNELDITPFIHSGQNRILADVYYQGLVNRVWNSGDCRQGMIADILVDGVPVCSTGSAWEYTLLRADTGIIRSGYDTQYSENYDNRVKPEHWLPAVERETDYTFCPVPQPTVTVYPKPLESLRPLPEGGWWLDFGTELTGSVFLRVTGRAGDRLRIRYGEECDGDGRVRYETRCGCSYEDILTLDEGENTWQAYDYKAFRYAEILPAEGARAELREAYASVRHFPFDEEACTLSCSDKVLEQVFALCKNTIRYGCQENYVDCPSREKGQYAGDLTITGASHLWLTGDPRLFAKAIDNLVQSQRVTPGMLAVAPGSLMQEIADYSLQFPLLVRRYYAFTGDRDFLRRMMEPCDRLLEHFRRFERPDGMLENVDTWNLVDWPENQRDDYDFPLTKPIGPGCHAVINAFYVGCVAQIEDFRRELGIPFVPRAEALRRAFNAAFYHPELGRYTDREGGTHGALHSNVLPLFYGLQPPGTEETLAAYIEGKGLRCGVYMAYFTLKALAACGHYQTVYDRITGTGENSWYNMLREGGTTCFEAWGKERKRNTSLCHPWASAPVSVLIEDILGLRCTAPGFRSVELDPHIPPAVAELEMRIPLPGGAVRVSCHHGVTEWHREENEKDS